MLRRGSSTYSKRSLTSKGAQRFHTTENFARLTRSLCLLPLLRRILSSSCLEAHLGGVFGFGLEFGAIILRKDAVPAQQFGQRPLFGDGAVAQHHDAVAAPHCRQPMGRLFTPTRHDLPLPNAVQSRDPALETAGN